MTEGHSRRCGAAVARARHERKTHCRPTCLTAAGTDGSRLPSAPSEQNGAPSSSRQPSCQDQHPASPPKISHTILPNSPPRFPPSRNRWAYPTQRQGTHLRSHPRTRFTVSAARHTPNLITQPPSISSASGSRCRRIPLPGPQAGWDPSRHSKTHDVSLETKLPALLTQASSMLCNCCRARDLLGGFPSASWRLFEHPQTPAVGPASPRPRG